MPHLPTSTKKGGNVGICSSKWNQSLYSCISYRWRNLSLQDCGGHVYSCQNSSRANSFLICKFPFQAKALLLNHLQDNTAADNSGSNCFQRILRFLLACNLQSFQEQLKCVTIISNCFMKQRSGTVFFQVEQYNTTRRQQLIYLALWQPLKFLLREISQPSLRLGNAKCCWLFQQLHLCSVSTNTLQNTAKSKLFCPNLKNYHPSISVSTLTLFSGKFSFNT